MDSKLYEYGTVRYWGVAVSDRSDGIRKPMHPHRSSGPVCPITHTSRPKYPPINFVSDPYMIFYNDSMINRKSALSPAHLQN